MATTANQLPTVDCLGNTLGTFETVQIIDGRPTLIGFVPAVGIPLAAGTVRVDYPGSKVINNEVEHELLALIAAVRAG